MLFMLGNGCKINLTGAFGYDETLVGLGMALSSLLARGVLIAMVYRPSISPNYSTAIAGSLSLPQHASSQEGPFLCLHFPLKGMLF